MKQTVLSLGLGALLVTNLLVSNEAGPNFAGIACAATKSEVTPPADSQSVKGQIASISQKARTIALTKNDKSFFLIKFDDKTELKGVASTKEFKEDEAIIAKYTVINGENIATSLEKALVKLPKGVKEIKTEELAELLAKGQDIALIDARPTAKYDESHIPGALSIPYAKFVKMGDDGVKLLEKYKEKQLVFYCGGAT